MITENIWIILTIIFQSTIYYSGLSWLSWKSERISGYDAFHIVIAFSFGVTIATKFSGESNSTQFLLLFTASAVSYIIDEYWNRFALKFDTKNSLVTMIVCASIFLVAFDWITSHTPVSFSLAFSLNRNVFLIVFVAIWIFVILFRNTRYIKFLCLGKHNIWAMEYWARPLPQKTIIYHILNYAMWVSVLALPLSTTGILSSTILKDVAYAILIARITSSRGLVTLFLISLSLSTLRIFVGYVFLNNAAPVLVDTVIFFCVLGWAQVKGGRTSWRAEDAH